MYGRLGSFFLAQYLADIDALGIDGRWPHRAPAEQDAAVLLKWFMIAGIASATLVVLVLLV